MNIHGTDCMQIPYVPTMQAIEHHTTCSQQVSPPGVTQKAYLPTCKYTQAETGRQSECNADMKTLADNLLTSDLLSERTQEFPDRLSAKTK